MLVMPVSQGVAHWSPTTLEENTRNIYEPTVLENAQVEANSMYIFTQIGLLRNTCINTKEIEIESQNLF